ncbi:MAG: NADPH:quinone oxidoreductase family protein [Reyranellaceae bacterium]
MRAVVCRAWADYAALPLEEIAAPAMRPGGVRIATHAAGVSFATTLITSGNHQTKPSFPFVPGTEVAGVVTECAPGVTRVAVGDRVCAAPEWGGHAEEVVALEHNVFAIPDSLPFATAVQFPLSYGTAYGALAWRARTRPGETVLVFGASGAVGLAAVEVAKALGATVIACVGSAAKAAVARQHGADHVLAGPAETLRDAIKEIAGSGGVDVVFDPVGGAAFDVALRAAGPLCRVIVIGFASGQRPVAPANILLVKNIDVIGFYFGRYIWDGVVPRLPWDRQVADAFVSLFGWYEAGLLQPTASLRFPLARYREAMQAVIDRRGIGKVVLEMPVAARTSDGGT